MVGRDVSVCLALVFIRGELTINLLNMIVLVIFCVSL